MATVKQIYRQALLNYPEQYNCPLDVSIHLFCRIGNGYYWEADGTVASFYSLTVKKYAFSEMPKYSNKELNISMQLERDASIAKYNFVQKNINKILKSDFTKPYFSSDRRHGYQITDSISDDTALAFTFPKKITKEWAVVLNEFLDWWTDNIRCFYDEKPWPRNISKAYKNIEEQRTRLAKRLGISTQVQAIAELKRIWEHV